MTCLGEGMTETSRQALLQYMSFSAERRISRLLGLTCGGPLHSPIFAEASSPGGLAICFN